jgi:hypothetical protein
MIELALIPLCSVLNRARGNRFWGNIPSTVESRFLFAIIIAAATTAMTGNIWVLPTLLAGLMLWCTPGWDTEWSAQIGNDPLHSKALGCVMMFLRQLLILPAFGAVAYICHGNYAYCGIAGLLWLPYLLFGIITKAKCIQNAEFANGALIGLALAMMIG